MVIKLKQALHNWINKPLKYDLHLRYDDINFGDIQSMFYPIIESKYRERLFLEYLMEPSEETIINFFKEEAEELKYGGCNLHKRVLRNCILMFGLSSQITVE